MNDDSLLRIGQQPVIDALAKVASGSVSYGHAYLISGADTVTVAEVATWFRTFLVCQKPSGVAPCATCAGCRSARHADGVWTHHLALQTDETTHTVERVRSVRQFVSVKSVSEGRRVVQVDSADTLRGPAANALLKNIEEPGKNVVYILTAQQYTAVLPTIRSRTMAIAIQPVTRAVQQASLVQAGYTKHAAEFASTLFPGQIGRASQFLANHERSTSVEALERLLTTWHDQNTAQRLRLASSLFEGLRDTSAVREKVLDALTVAACLPKTRQRFLRQLLQACLQLRTNAQPKLIFDAFALQTL